jgi:biotin transport system substrate-specific component
MSTRVEPFAGGTFLQAAAARADLSPAVRTIAVLFATVATIAAAQVSIPLPFTLGPRLGFTCQIAYLALGLAGLPVFAASPALPQGAARLLGPTGGYLMSYPFAALVAGHLAARGFDRRYLTSVLAMAAGLAVVFTCGVCWMAFGMPHVGLGAAVAAGLVPFLPADILKIFLAATVLPAAWLFLR